MSNSDWPKARLSHYLVGLRDGTHGTFERVAIGVPLLSAKNVQNGRLDISDESLISESDAASIVANGFPAQGDVLLTIVGTVGRSAVYEHSAPQPFQRSVAFLRPDQRLDPYFLQYQLASDFVQDQMRLATKTSAQPGLYLGAVAALTILVPPLDVQRQVVAYLDREAEKIDALIDEAEGIVAVARERRVALITAAATGRIDVGDVV